MKPNLIPTSIVLALSVTLAAPAAFAATTCSDNCTCTTIQFCPGSSPPSTNPTQLLGAVENKVGNNKIGCLLQVGDSQYDISVGANFSFIHNTWFSVNRCGDSYRFYLDTNSGWESY